MQDRFFGAHEFQARDEVVKPSSERSFGLVFACFFAFLGALSIWRARAGWHYWFPLAALFAVVAYAAPRVLAPLNRLWAKFGLLLHHIVSPLVLGIMFYVCITPIGFLMRLVGKDPMRRRFEPEAKSYWIVRDPPGPAPETLQEPVLRDMMLASCANSGPSCACARNSGCCRSSSSWRSSAA